MSAAISIDEHDDIARVTLRNDAKLNALSFAMWQQLRAGIERLAASPTLRCIHIRGAGEQAFSAGADISEFAEMRSTREQVVRFHEEGVGACLTALLECPVPIVAEIRGACMGGGLEIASACDIRLADETARFGAPVGRLGFPLAFAETQAVYNVVGPAVAAELLLEGRVLTAEEALARGLITRLVPSGMLAREVETTLANVCKSGRWAARSHKRQFRRLMQDPTPVSVTERMEVYGFAETDEYRDGIRRFLARKQGSAGS